MAEKKVLVCDQCSGDEARRWVFAPLGKPTREVDLCEQCSEPFEDMTAMSRPHNPKKRGPYRKFEKVEVVEPRKKPQKAP